MTSTVGSLFGKSGGGRFKYKACDDFLLPSVYIGLEVEVEDTGLGGGNYDCLPNIKCVSDNSLRNNGAEFIFEAPVFGEDLKDSINNLSDTIEGLPHQATFGFRTSTHVHLDVRDLTPKEVVKIIFMYSILEPLFYQIDNAERWNSPFAQPLSVSLFNPDFMKAIKKAMRSTNLNTHLITTSDDRYYALNLSSISKFGSLEFRMFNATKSKSELKKLINLVMMTRDTIGLLTDSYSINEEGLRAYLHHKNMAFVPDLNCYESLLKIYSSAISDREFTSVDEVSEHSNETGADFNV